MSWLFDAVGEKLELAATPLTDEPFTLSAWVKTSDLAPASQAFVMAVGVTSSSSNNFAIYQTSGAATVVGRIRDTTNATCTSTASLSGTGTWHHVAFRGDGANNYTIYLDGANSASVVSTKAPAGLNGIIIGNEWGGSRWRGRVAQVSMWNSDIGAADIADLAAGRNPLDTGYFSAPSAYWTLDNSSTGLDDISGAAFGSLTATGATFDSDNPTVDAIPSSGHPAQSRTRGIPGMNTIASPFGRGW